MIKKISIIGSGNVATRLSKEFLKHKIQIVQIISRNKKNGQSLADRVQASFTTNINNLQLTDLAIICVNDDSIKDIAKKIPTNQPAVHTSGFTNIKILKKQENYGVIYPLQSLNKDIDINFQEIPICIESNNMIFKKKIKNLCLKLSINVVYLNSTERQHIHLAAVITSNFSNFLYLIAQKHLHQNNIDFTLLLPLIIHTAKKTKNQNPFTNQTGPAKRGDKKVIKKHLEILNNKDHRKIYKLLSKNILKTYEK
tara:strand:- start:181 stop:942 length:762 start_codon:yes stop_codon:yes gene_type:complete